MDNLEYEINRIEDFYNSFKSSNHFDCMKEFGLICYREKLSNLYTEQRKLNSFIQSK